MLSIPLELRLTMIAGSVLYFGLILILLRKKKLNVQYSIIWLASAVLFLCVAVFPVTVAAIGNFFGVLMPANVVFSLLFVFILLLLLSLSVIVTGFAAHIKRLAQTQALLEERLRRLEAEKAERPAPAGEENGGKRQQLL